jgi:hypothetical protein
LQVEFFFRYCMLLATDSCFEFELHVLVNCPYDMNCGMQFFEIFPVNIWALGAVCYL